ncbi:hypothetical protein SGPA1_21834 [Streptomyces misionensis JCM 4497]
MGRPVDKRASAPGRRASGRGCAASPRVLSPPGGSGRDGSARSLDRLPDDDGLDGIDAEAAQVAGDELVEVRQVGHPDGGVQVGDAGGGEGTVHGRVPGQRPSGRVEPVGRHPHHHIGVDGQSEAPRIDHDVRAEPSRCGEAGEATAHGGLGVPGVRGHGGGRGPRVGFQHGHDVPVDVVRCSVTGCGDRGQGGAFGLGEHVVAPVRGLGERVQDGVGGDRGDGSGRRQFAEDQVIAGAGPGPGDGEDLVAGGRQVDERDVRSGHQRGGEGVEPAAEGTDPQQQCAHGVGAFRQRDDPADALGRQRLPPPVHRARAHAQHRPGPPRGQPPVTLQRRDKPLIALAEDLIRHSIGHDRQYRSRSRL